MIVAFQTLIYFRESLFTALDWLIPIWPYYKKWTLSKNDRASEDSDEDQVFADYDDEKGVVFYPPVYAQRYAAVADCLMDDRWATKIERVVDFGYNDMSFIKYLKDVPGIKCILGVDIESLPLRCSSDLLACDDYSPKRESPLQITLYEGNAADPDYRLIGCDAVVAIEMIEHMIPHDLERLVHTVFGFIKPQIAVFTTPNGDFNVLFKALEKNGLRRLDHFFEWTREQFHDWCSNIVLRYPDYTVTCKGIGPGPQGTQRLGCCSQLALFICKDYHKQQDLDLNCLALVANAPKRTDLDELTDSWESPDPITETNMLCAPENTESYGELLFSEKQSYITLVLASSDSTQHIVYKDKIAQCNIDAERGRNFIMFDEDILCYNVLIPQRKINSKVYEFEDVANRLNCSTFQVKKFSKTTQNLMAKNKIDSLVHTREIVDEIRHMTKVLNFNKNTLHHSSTVNSNIWNNINWGDDAPYWNQYYKTIKEINYPFETKSDECRILDLISDEINGMIDAQDNRFAVEINKLEIPLDHLMQTVKHLTDDIHKVKDVLEWNGYEIVDNVLIYSRLNIDNTSVGSPEDGWQDNDVLSDWDMTDGRSLSDASTMMPDAYGRSLRRAVDLKMKKLRSLLSAEDDITIELDRVVCRLIKLAIRTSEAHQTPPPATWMQRKLLDLLTLTEKSIERRRKLFIENYPLKAIRYDTLDSTPYKWKNNDVTEQILDKYLMLSPDIDNEDFVLKSEIHRTDDDLSATSNEMEPFILEQKSLYGEVRLESMKSDSKEEIHVEITKAWVDGVCDMVSPAHVVKSDVRSSDSNTSNDSQFRNEEIYKSDFKVGSKNKFSKLAKANRIKARQSNNKLIKSVSKKRSSFGQLCRRYSKNFEYFEYESYTLNKPKMFKEHNKLQSTTSKPIPRSLIELCYQDFRDKANSSVIYANNNSLRGNVADTKESCFVDIIGDDIEETIALRRTIATEVNPNHDVMEHEDILERVINITKDDSFYCDHVDPIETIDSETIFLYDLNEPSTSKGIRHVSADVQCGTDILALCPNPSVVSPIINATNIRETGIKIDDSHATLKVIKHFVDFGTITDEYHGDHLSVFKKRLLKDSETILVRNVDCSTITRDSDMKLADTRILKPLLSVLNTKENQSESVLCSLTKPSNGEISRKVSVSRYKRPKLSCGGIHVHSFRDRQVSEDVIFQGEWLRNRPNTLAKKSPNVQIMTRKREILMKKKKVNSKENVHPWKRARVIGVAGKMSDHKQILGYTKIKQEVLFKHYNRQSNSLTENVGNSNNVKKVASKIVTSIMTSKNLKSNCAIPNKPLLKFNTLKSDNYVKKMYTKFDKFSFKHNTKQYIMNANKLNKTGDKTLMKEIIKPPLIRSKTEGLKDTLLKFNEKQKNITYIVLRNEIENSRSANSSSESSKPLTKRNGSRNNYSPPSQKSSPCSSPNSAATVRALPLKATIGSNKHINTSPGKNSSGNISAEKIENYEVKKYFKQSNTKLINPSSVLYVEKENLPETSKRYKINKKDEGNFSKAMVSDRTKKVFMVKMKPESPPDRKKCDSIAAYVPNRSNSKVINQKNIDNHHILPKRSSFKKLLANTNTSPVRSKDNAASIHYDRLSEINLTRTSTPILDISNTIQIEGQDFGNYVKNNKKYTVRRSNSALNAAMNKLIEERLNFIGTKQDNDISDTDTVILNAYGHDESLNDCLSPISYKTIVTSENTCNISGRDIENALLNCSFESDFGNQPILDISSHDNSMPASSSVLSSINTDLLLYKSTESITKTTEYICAHNELDNTLVPQNSSDAKIVHDIFERKDENALKNAGGVLAAQAFSGFSMDGEPVAGDQPKYISLVDPETGYLALEVARQVTSEELFVSGRSSDTYESCYLEDDAFVPNWLFHVASRQSSAEISEEAQQMSARRDEDVPEYDVNGNTMDAGFGVGAGDGRGMHSDQSQDSSGRGTSISSSDASSGSHSEAVLIDTSVFLGSAHAVSAAGPMPAVPVESSDVSFRTVETIDTDNEVQCNDENIRLNRVAGASDVDADVSSLETDAAESDN